MNGFLLIDKEEGCTSFDVVRKVRGITGERKVGHAGTLDPFATGLLVLALGEGTKLLEFFIGLDKVYEFVAVFGYSSDTFDCDGDIVEKNINKAFSRDEVLAVIREKFTGEISQVPPKYSALKVDGRRACDIMRSGGYVEMRSRNVRIYNFDIVGFDWPRVSFRVRCGSGTYIRSLVNDLGDELGCGGYVKELRRVSVGDFYVSDAVKLASLDKKVDQKVFSLEKIVDSFESFSLNNADFEGLKDGRILKDKKIAQDGPVMAFYNGRLVGVLENSSDGLGIKYKKVIK